MGLGLLSTQVMLYSTTLVLRLLSTRLLTLELSREQALQTTRKGMPLKKTTRKGTPLKVKDLALLTAFEERIKYLG